MRAQRPSDQQRAAALGDAQHRGERTRSRRGGVQRAIEVEVVDARRAARERTPERQPVERTARVGRRRARVGAARGEGRDDRGSGRRARGDGDVAVEHAKSRERAAYVGGEGTRRIVQRRRERDVEPRPTGSVHPTGNVAT